MLLYILFLAAAAAYAACYALHCFRRGGALQGVCALLLLPLPIFAAGVLILTMLKAF